MSCVPAQITSTREQEYFVHQRSSAIKEITQNDPRKGSLKSTTNRKQEILRNIISATGRNSTPSGDNTKIPIPHPPPLPARVFNKKKKNTTQKFNSLLPASSTESLTQKTSSKENRQEKKKLKAIRNRAADASSSSRRNKSFSPTTTLSLPHVDNHACILWIAKIHFES